MIAIDTSALLAIVLAEPTAESCMRAMAENARILISAGTFAEALIVAGRRNVAVELEAIVSLLGFEIVPVTSIRARRIAEAYARWGKGVHAASLNFGDCFAYDVAKEHDCPLLYVGNDFARTDVTGVL